MVVVVVVMGVLACVCGCVHTNVCGVWVGWRVLVQMRAHAHAHMRALAHTWAHACVCPHANIRVRVCMLARMALVVV